MTRVARWLLKSRDVVHLPCSRAACPMLLPRSFLSPRSAARYRFREGQNERRGPRPRCPSLARIWILDLALGAPAPSRARHRILLRPRSCGRGRGKNCERPSQWRGAAAARGLCRACPSSPSLAAILETICARYGAWRCKCPCMCMNRCVTRHFTSWRRTTLTLIRRVRDPVLLREPS
ncbi:hypothetical protein B0H14DRAFT_2829131 [Mycena olivaceomarginata]|nr:hypothetical protein B0H14DRAFT_2829131 [Mycena olivaceomarginata]